MQFGNSVLVMAFLALSLSSIAQRNVQHSAAIDSADAVLRAVGRYAVEMQPDDRLVDFQGIQVKASNLHGIEVRGQRYYYRVAHHMSLDPLSLGSPKEVFTAIGTLNRGMDWEVIVYAPTGESE